MQIINDVGGGFMTLENLDVRRIVAERQIPYRAIAKQLGVTPEHLSRCMGYPLKEDMKKRILAAIEEIRCGSQSA